MPDERFENLPTLVDQRGLDPGKIFERITSPHPLPTLAACGFALVVEPR